MHTKIEIMTTQQIADRLVELCRKGDFETAQKELYDESIVSIEPVETENFEKETRGLPAILSKGKKFYNMVETVYAITVSDPIVASHAIAFVLSMDLKMKEKDRINMAELCVYETRDGKVISEHFFM